MCALRCNHRFVLTGTPVQNDASDLWAILEFLMPGFLGARPQFKSKFNRRKGARGGGRAVASREGGGGAGASAVGGGSEGAIVPEMVLRMEELHRKVCSMRTPAQTSANTNAKHPPRALPLTATHFAHHPLVPTVHSPRSYPSFSDAKSATCWQSCRQK